MNSKRVSSAGNGGAPTSIPSMLINHRFSLTRTHRQVLVAEFTPHAHNFYPLGPVRFHQEFISHDGHPAKRQRKFSPPAIDASTLTLARISVASPLVNNCLLTRTF